ncbi:MAG: LysM peptidoglycan-binding domain-containing protein, partial [Nitrospinota bacterium]
EYAGQYRVRPGDTLSGIAQQFSIPLQQLLELNAGRDPRRLQAGALVRLPQAAKDPAEEKAPAPDRAGTHHVVGPGENVWAIAQRYGVSPDDLLRWNSLSTSAVIFPGDRLRVRR